MKSSNLRLHKKRTNYYNTLKTIVIDRFGLTPLIYASYYGKLNVVEILLQYGAHLGGALHCAAYKGDTRIVQLLIRFSADVNSQNQHNQTTPLHIASRIGYIDIVECLGMFLNMMSIQ